MFCQQCGNFLPDLSRVCEYCGYNNDRSFISNKALLVAAFAAVISFVGIVVSILPRSHSSNDSQIRHPSASEAQATPDPTPTPYWKTENYAIKIHTITLGVGQMWSQPLDIKEEWRNAKLVGHFKTQGGLRDDIYACITDQDGIENMKSGLGHNVWYESGRTSVDTINAPLPSGRSYFVLKNKYAWLTSRSVSFDLNVEYEHLVYPGQVKQLDIQEESNHGQKVGAAPQLSKE